MGETGDSKKDGEEGFSSLTQAFATYGETNPDSYPPSSVFELPDVSLPDDPPELTVVEKMHLEAQILKWEEPEHRKNAADSLIELAKEEEITLPTICRIRDILSFHNNRLGGKELASHVRKAKSLADKKVQSTLNAFERMDTPSYPPPPGKLTQPRIVECGKKIPVKQ